MPSLQTQEMDLAPQRLRPFDDLPDLLYTLGSPLLHTATHFVKPSVSLTHPRTGHVLFLLTRLLSVDNAQLLRVPLEPELVLLRFRVPHQLFILTFLYNRTHA